MSVYSKQSQTSRKVVQKKMLNMDMYTYYVWVSKDSTFYSSKTNRSVEWHFALKQNNPFLESSVIVIFVKIYGVIYILWNFQFKNRQFCSKFREISVTFLFSENFFQRTIQHIQQRTWLYNKKEGTPLTKMQGERKRAATNINIFPITTTITIIIIIIIKTTKNKYRLIKSNN